MQGLGAAQDEETVEWPRCAADRILVVGEALMQFSVIDDEGAADDIGMSAEILGRLV